MFEIGRNWRISQACCLICYYQYSRLRTYVCLLPQNLNFQKKIIRFIKRCISQFGTTRFFRRHKQLWRSVNFQDFQWSVDPSLVTESLQKPLWKVFKEQRLVVSKQHLGVGMGQPPAEVDCSPDYNVNICIYYTILYIYNLYIYMYNIYIYIHKYHVWYTSTWDFLPPGSTATHEASARFSMYS